MDNLTAREHLVLLAEIRGVPKQLVRRVVERAIVDMSLNEKAGAVSKTYSGGNKRKLSVAMSIVANPKVTFLDEPSTGMDPETRRHMWAFISRIARSRAVVLTTHSMEEADALCSKIGIMIHGNLRAQGSSQELKAAYGTGYLIQVRFSDEADPLKYSAELAAVLRQLSPGLKVEDSSTRAFRFEVPQSDCSIGPLFKTLIESQQQLSIEDFSVSQTTLEVPLDPVNHSSAPLSPTLTISASLICSAHILAHSSMLCSHFEDRVLSICLLPQSPAF